MFSVFRKKPSIDEFASALFSCTFGLAQRALNEIDDEEGDYVYKIAKARSACRGIVDACLQLLIDKQLSDTYGDQYFNSGMDAVCNILSAFAAEKYSKAADSKSERRLEEGEVDNYAVMKEWGQRATDEWHPISPGGGSILIFRKQLKQRKIDEMEIQDPFKGFLTATDNLFPF